MGAYVAVKSTVVVVASVIVWLTVGVVVMSVVAVTLLVAVAVAPRSVVGMSVVETVTGV